MRPPEFTGGNLPAKDATGRAGFARGFNEAAGIHRRKHSEHGGLPKWNKLLQ